jgi:hypothetical protein
MVRLALGLCLLGVSVLSAQDTLRGKAVRVTAPSVRSRRIEGLYTWRERDTLTITSVDTAWHVPLGAITHLDVAAGTDRRRGAMFGAGLGLLSAGLQIGIEHATRDKTRPSIQTASVMARLGSGVVGGAIIGTLAFPFRKWHAVDLHILNAS